MKAVYFHGHGGPAMGTRSGIRREMGLVFAGRLKPVVDRALPPGEIRAAHGLLVGRNVFGRLVLKP
jgi:NADPH:quinone reductase-like Zn-dependent oxidoreductase